MKKKCLFFSVLLIILPITLCTCTQSTNQQKNSFIYESPLYSWETGTEETLTIWGRETDLKRSYLKKAFSRYEQLTGNHIQTVPFSTVDFESETAAALADKSTAPDLILSFGGVNIDSFHPDENLYDFTDAVWVDDLTDTSASQTIYHGKVIGLPHWEASVSGTLYNKEIFHKLGISPPKTQAEFLSTCELLLQNGITPLYLPSSSPSMLLYQFPLDTLIHDSEKLQMLNDGTIGYADFPEMIAVVEWYQTMAQKGYLGENYADNDWDGMNEALKSGSYAMMLGWDTWLYTDFDGDPSQFGLMPAFIGIPEKGTFEGPNLSLLMVNKNSERLSAALNFITFMADPYNYNVAFADTYTAPVFKKQLSGISTPQYVEASGWIEKYYHNSTAWLRIRGFSQDDAVCIVRSMENPEEFDAMECLLEMDRLRKIRLGIYS